MFLLRNKKKSSLDNTTFKTLLSGTLPKGTQKLFIIIRAPDKRGVLRIIQRYFFVKKYENTSCDPSLEPSQREGFNEWSQYVFMEKYGKLPLNFLVRPDNHQILEIPQIATSGIIKVLSR